MSLSDFERCTPSEFAAVAARWRECRDEILRQGWERSRFMAAMTLQPYSRKPVRPTDVASFPWDGESRKGADGTRRGAPSTRERMREIEERVRNAGKSDGDFPCRQKRPL